MKYRITTTQTTAKDFDSCDVEAKDESEAKEIVEKMIVDGTLTEDSEVVEYDHSVETIEDDEAEG